MSIFRSTRRWLRFSLRSFLIFVTLFCIWAAWYVDRARKQKAAVEAVRDYGGWVYYDFQQFDPDTGNRDPLAESSFPTWLIDSFGVDMFHRIEAVNLVYNDDTGKRLDNPNVSDDIIPKLLAFPGLRALYLKNRQVTDETMQYIGNLRKLECLAIWDASEVSDGGVAYLAALKQLKSLHISNAKIGDESLRILARLPSIERLSLQGNYFSDRGLKYFANAKQLKSLWIGAGHGEITDAGAAHLLNLNKLQELDLQRYSISPEMRDRLKRLPMLKQLYWNPPLGLNYSILLPHIGYYPSSSAIIVLPVERRAARNSRSLPSLPFSRYDL